MPSESAGTEPAVRVTSSWLKGVKRLFAWVALLAMGAAIWRSWGFLVSAWSTAAAAYILAAIALWATTHLLSPWCMVLVLGHAKAIDYQRALAVHALRLPAKYLPGGIWHMVGRVTDLRELGHARRSLVEFVLIENLVAAGFALGVGAALLHMTGESRWRGALAAVATLGFLSLAVVPWIVKLAARSGATLPLRRYLKLLAVTAGFWAVASTAFVVFIRGFATPIAQLTTPALVGTYLFSWGAGFVAFFAPQGIGVFEFVSSTLLGQRLDLAEAVALMASFRIIVLAGDLAAWAVAGLFFHRLTVG